MPLRLEPLDPALMTHDERVAEVAAILAAGALRARRDIDDPAMKKLVILAADSFLNSLADGDETSVHGLGG